MPDNSTDNKRIAKNTILLYIRMMFLLAISLYTSRVVLATLGVEDFGLYNVVGGVVTMFTFLNSAMGNSSHRYITYALGKGDKKELHNIVCATCMIHWIVAGIIFIIAETIGLWFLFNKMVIPEERMTAAIWVYQFSIIACMVTIVSVPYNALIIAHEKMSAFAFISILDAILKLLIVFLIRESKIDKLVLYGLLILCVNILIRGIYQVYCKQNFPESKNICFKKNPHLKELTAFASWSLIGNCAFMGYTQGLNILLNMFFGPAVNAARGIAFQVQGATKSFVTSFQMAVNPQITKSYASGNLERTKVLIFSSSKMSFYLFLCLCIPIYLEAGTILNLWLVEVPEHSISFLRIIMLTMLIDTLTSPIGIANNATGNIRNYQIIEGGILLLILPISYTALKKGYAPESVFYVQLCIFIIVQLVRVQLVKKKINFTYISYVRSVLIRICLVSIMSISLPYLVYKSLPNDYTTFSLIFLLSPVCVLLSSYLLGLSTPERIFVNNKIKKTYTSLLKKNKK